MEAFTCRDAATLLLFPRGIRRTTECITVTEIRTFACQNVRRLKIKNSVVSLVRGLLKMPLQLIWLKIELDRIALTGTGRIKAGTNLLITATAIHEDISGKVYSGIERHAQVDFHIPALFSAIGSIGRKSLRHDFIDTHIHTGRTVRTGNTDITVLVSVKLEFRVFGYSGLHGKTEGHLALHAGFFGVFAVNEYTEMCSTPCCVVIDILLFAPFGVRPCFCTVFFEPDATVHKPVAFIRTRVVGRYATAEHVGVMQVFGAVKHLKLRNKRVQGMIAAFGKRIRGVGVRIVRTGVGHVVNLLHVVDTRIGLFLVIEHGTQVVLAFS
ncbi:unknown [Bacteroides sp. CAG:598]|nr:unknown [Bacteroides sp. CAG:598]